MIIRSMFVVALAVASFNTIGAYAQDPRPTKTPSDPENAASAPTGKTELGADGALRAAFALLDRLEAGDIHRPAPEDVETLARYVEVIRSAEPGNPRLQYLFGWLMALNGRQGDAIAAMRSFLETREGRNDWRAHKILGDLYVGAYPQLAKSEYEEADSLKGHVPGVLYGLSRCAFKLGRSDEAAELARKAVAADGGKTLRFVSHLARIHAARHDWAQADREARAALGIAQATGGDRPGEAALLETIDAQYALLIDITQSRLTESPGVAQRYLQLAGLIGERAENARLIAWRKALTVLANGVEATAPSATPGMKEQYAVALAELGRHDEAVATFQEILTADPTNELALQWLARLQPVEPDAQPAPPNSVPSVPHP